MPAFSSHNARKLSIPPTPFKLTDMNSPLPLHHLLPPADHHGDTDPEETLEWRESFQPLISNKDSERGHFMLQELLRLASSMQVSCLPPTGPPKGHPIAAPQQPD